jgi:hypothetical protein
MSPTKLTPSTTQKRHFRQRKELTSDFWEPYLPLARRAGRQKIRLTRPHTPRSHRDRLPARARRPTPVVPPPPRTPLEFAAYLPVTHPTTRPLFARSTPHQPGHTFPAASSHSIGPTASRLPRLPLSPPLGRPRRLTGCAGPPPWHVVPPPHHGCSQWVQKLA